MQRLRIIAPLVGSTLYNGLWSDSRSGHFTKQCTHVHHEYQFLAPLLIIETSSATSSVCSYSKQQSSFISPSRGTFSRATYFEELQPIHFYVKPHSLCQTLLLQEVFLWWCTLCKNFLAVYPALNPPLQSTTSFHNRYIRLFAILLAKIETRYVRCRKIY